VADGAQIAVSMRDISKSFGDVLALDGVSLELREGEIRALVGENGAGKTTLMNILYGMYRADSGTISIRGAEVGADWSPRKAIQAGIGMIHQHFSLIPPYTVLENVVMPHLTWGQVAPGWSQHRQKLEELIAAYGFSLDLDDRVEDIPVGQQQETEILKMLYQGATILILDEPTAVLTPQQIDGLLELLVRLRGEGHSVVLITHKLKEAMAVADRITVCRAGHVIDTVERAGTSLEDVAGMMVSHTWVQRREYDLPVPGSDVALEVRDLVTAMVEGERAVHGMSFEMRSGEILGIAGVSGNGQTELAEALVGQRKAVRGRIVLGGKDATRWSISRRADAGLGSIPESREIYGCVGDMTLAENLVYDRCDKAPFSRLGVLNRRAIQDNAGEAIEEFDVRTPSAAVPVCTLSGGNQQKVVLARVLSGGAKVVLASQPTRGLDFAATEFVREQLVAAAQKGVGVLLISSDLEELLALSHRMLIMYRGRVVGELARGEFDVSRIGLLMAGQTDGSAASCASTATVGAGKEDRT